MQQTVMSLFNERTPAMKRIAVLTSGGDAPGMNAAIRAVTRRADFPADRKVPAFDVVTQG